MSLVGMLLVGMRDLRISWYFYKNAAALGYGVALEQFLGQPATLDRIRTEVKDDLIRLYGGRDAVETPELYVYCIGNLPP